MKTGAKKITRQAVCLAATTLILAEGSTTTLDVKNHLRNRGYRAYQAEVSTWLFAVAQQQNWAINDNGTYRVYYFAPLTALPARLTNRTKNN
ncbi:hypothetical protein [Larkinella arboricola]|nr:hypothetical protein [Larkinella arboricola]